MAAAALAQGAAPLSHTLPSKEIVDDVNLLLYTVAPDMGFLCDVELTGNRAVVSVHPFDGSSAAIVLSGRVLNHVEYYARRQRLGRCEVDASQWYFDRHGAREIATRDVAPSIARRGEYTLAERTSLQLGTTFLEGFLTDESAEHLTAGERAYARALGQRVTGVFEVVGSNSDSARFENLSSHTVHEVEVLDGEEAYEPEILVFGSLIPSGSVWQLTPGAVFARCDDSTEIREIAAGRLIVSFERRGRSPALERLISIVVHEQPDARFDLPPRSSVGEARAALADLVTALADAGFGESAPRAWAATIVMKEPSSEPARIIPLGTSDSRSADLGPDARRLDRPVREWQEALHGMIAEDERGAGRARRN